MFNKTKKLLKRVECDAFKILFSISVKELKMPLNNAIKDGTILSVCFERGGKISTTKSKPITKASCTVDKTSSYFKFDEKVELVATMYRDKKFGKYQRKRAKLILRQLKKNR